MQTALRRHETPSRLWKAELSELHMDASYIKPETKPRHDRRPYRLPYSTSYTCHTLVRHGSDITGSLLVGFASATYMHCTPASVLLVQCRPPSNHPHPLHPPGQYHVLESAFYLRHVWGLSNACQPSRLAAVEKTRHPFLPSLGSTDDPPPPHGCCYRSTAHFGLDCAHTNQPITGCGEGMGCSQFKPA